MNETTKRKERTCALLTEHFRAYPALQSEDVFKFLFQSSYGCEHLVSDEEAALHYVKREYASLSKTEPPRIDPLDGAYSRVYLSFLNVGLKPETLTKLFCRSAKKEVDGGILLEEKIQVARELVLNGELPPERETFEAKLNAWRAEGCPAIHHSDVFRAEYRPAYRVIANRYVDWLPLFTEIDRRLAQDSVVVAVEGGSASGKTTLASMLQEIYDCNVLPMDDFFLRPEQRTPERLAEVGGNLDRERFAKEVLISLQGNAPITYRRFDCSVGELSDPITVTPKRLTIVEGVYAMHPAFGKYYDLSVFLEIDPECQRKRIVARNTSPLADRFLNEWIPMEDRYFAETKLRERCDLTVRVGQ